VRDSGVPCTAVHLPAARHTDHRGLTILFIRDPDGILVELVQRPRSFFR